MEQAFPIGLKISNKLYSNREDLNKEHNYQKLNWRV